MYWFDRPGYLRWVAAAAILVLAVSAEFRPTPLERRAFLVEDVPAGRVVADDDIEWREVPAGLLPEVVVAGVAAADLRAGEPLLPSALAPPPLVPDDWWALEVSLPGHPGPGTAVRLVTSGAAVEGVVVDSGDGPGDVLVAVPATHVGAVVAALHKGELVALLAP